MTFNALAKTAAVTLIAAASLASVANAQGAGLDPAVEAENTFIANQATSDGPVTRFLSNVFGGLSIGDGFDENDSEFGKNYEDGE